MKKRAGFSLIELMMVIVIIGIAAAIALPSMSGWFGKKDLDSISRQIFTDFQRAKNEAITTGRTIQIQVHMDPDWYRVLYTSSGSDIDIVPQTNMPLGITIDSATFPLSAVGNTTGITPRGFATQQGSVTIRSDNAPTANRDRTITLTLGGVVSIE
jgi:type IV fimbrial biogenesis protein FimT